MRNQEVTMNHYNHNIAPEDDHELGDTSDDDFETVVRKRHSNVNSLKLRNGGMGSLDSGKRQDFQTNRNNNNVQRERRSFRDRGRRKIQQENNNRDMNIRKQGERDRDRRQQQNAVPSQQQPPTTTTNSKTITNNNSSSSSSQTNCNKSSCANGISVRSSSVGNTSRNKTEVTNGSICSESSSGTSSLGTPESLGNISNNSNGGLLDVVDGHHHQNQNNQHGIIVARFRHLSGESASASASVSSTCETDNVLVDIVAQNLIEESIKPLFVVAPPPTVNPWHVNPNAASIIVKKNPALKITQPLSSSTTQPSTPVGSPKTSQKKPTVILNGGKDKEKTNKNNNNNNNNDTEFRVNHHHRYTGPRNYFRGDFSGKQKVQKENRDIRKQGERDRDKRQQQLNAVPSQQQPPTTNSKTTISSISQTNCNKSSCANGISVRSSSVGIRSTVEVINNGSISSSESGSSLEIPESFVNNINSNNSNGLLDVVDAHHHQNHNNNNHPAIIVAHFRHLSGESASASASASSTCETDNVHADIAQNPEESIKPQFIVAPPPTVNPWRVNPNAASIIAKKTPAPKTTQPLPATTQSAPVGSPKTSQKKPVTTLNEEKGTDKTNKAINTTTQLTTNTSANSQTVEQSTAFKTNKISPTSPPKSVSELSQQQPHQNKEIQEQAPTKPPTQRRAFAAVAKNQKIGLNKNQCTGPQSSQEDWPSLQETLVVVTPITIASSKSVITMTHEPGKLTGTGSSGIDSTTDTEDLTFELQKKELPSIISDDVGISTDHHHHQEKISQSNILESSSDAVTEDTPSEASISGDIIETHATKEESRDGIIPCINKIECTSTSSDDNEHGNLNNELDTETISGSTRKGKKSKQKWVPLSLPETPSSKSKTRRDRNSVEKDNIKDSSTNNNKPKTKMSSNKENGPVSSDGRMNHSYPPRGRGRNSNGMRGRGGRASRGHHWNYRDTNDPTSPDPREEYTDYPPDYTTLPPMYPVTEFIMPYLTNGYFPATFSPPAGAVMDDAQITSAYVPVDDTVINDMVKKQIEYYFSEENLEKDFYLRRKMDAEGFLPVNFIATFPRVKNMTQDYNVVIQAIQSSQDLELKEDLSCVRTRKQAIKWPITNEAALGLTPVHSVVPFPPTSVMAYQTPNGFVSLSVSSSSPTTCTPTPSISEKLNPNVPEFVPKSKVTTTSTTTTAEAFSV